MKGNGMSSDTEATEGEGPQLRQRPVRDARRGIAETALWLAVTAERVGAEAAQQALPIAGSDDKPVDSPHNSRPTSTARAWPVALSARPCPRTAKCSTTAPVAS